MTAASIITPKNYERDGRIEAIQLHATCPWCDLEISFDYCVLRPDFERQLNKHQGHIMVHTHPECGRQVIVKGKTLRRYTGARNTWELSADERAAYIPRQGDYIKYDAGHGQQTYIITSLPANTSENVLATIRDYQAKKFSPWGLWFHAGRSKTKIKPGTIEDVENQTGLRFPRFTRKPFQTDLFDCL